MTPLETTIVAAIIAFGAAPALALWWWMADSLKMKVQSGRNDDDAAVRTFVRVVDAAKESLVVHDDGNKMADTLYDNNDAICAVRRQLEKEKTLRIRFLLNEEADLAMVRALRAEFPSRTELRYMRDGRPPDDIHYKIADGGAIGHLSDHEPGQPERHFKLLDCLATKPRSRTRVFGKYLRRFEQDFESARPL